MDEPTPKVGQVWMIKDGGSRWVYPKKMPYEARPILYPKTEDLRPYTETVDLFYKLNQVIVPGGDVRYIAVGFNPRVREYRWHGGVLHETLERVVRHMTFAWDHEDNAKAGRIAGQKEDV